MSTTVLVEPALSQALNAAILPKLGEVGWSTGSDDDANLAEYIVLLVVNGKTQQEIASELCGDLLGLGPDDPQAQHFSEWLFQQVDVLKVQAEGGESQIGENSVMLHDTNANGAHDEVMGDVAETGGESTIPTGPKSMRNGGGARSNPRDKRMLGHLAKAMDRSSDAVLHRVRATGGNERINSHRAPPTGPRQPMSIRGGARGVMNGRQNGMSMHMNQAIGNDPASQAQLLYNMMQQQQAFFNMLSPDEQMAMQQQMGGQITPVFNPNFIKPHGQGKSLFDRVQAPPNRQQNRNNENFGKNHTAHDSTPSSSMEVQMSQDKPELSPDTICRYNLACTNKDCKFAHQSPEAPPGTTIDVTDICTFGAACKNRKCTGRHPSPAQRIAHQTEMDCRFYPNCTNARCPFKHPTMPACRNGADCTVPNCKFSHNSTLCRFNPCLNAACIYKHEEGQKRGKFEDKVWVAKEHVSERKFELDDGKPEELIIPGQALSQASSGTAELIT